ncbi:MAG TPA: VWA domain-containing protein [Vicinamibacterales bacterium]|nr:VWA domain-containing protein [Vicinamibacterales bacterium]
MSVQAVGQVAAIVALTGGMVLGVHAQPPPARQQQAPSAGQQPPRFRSSTQIVEVDVRVFDKDGQFVTNLKPGDFEIKENGTVQPIVTATLIGGAPAVSGSAASAAAPSTPALPSAPAATPPAAPSTWIFLFDTIHLSPAGLHHTRDAVKSFLAERLQKPDLAGVVANGKMLGNHLTTNHEELAKAIDGIKVPDELTNLTREMKFDYPRLQDEYEAWLIAAKDDGQALDRAVARACRDEPQLCPTADSTVRAKASEINSQFHRASLLTLDTLRVLSHGLARMAGPKTLVFVSEGFMMWGVSSELRDAIGEANRAGAHVYAIDARGLNKGHGTDLLMARQADAESSLPAFDEQVDGPNSLAIDTGGMFLENENDFGKALDTVQHDAGTYYVIGYTPTNQTFDGKYRTISVKVDRPGVNVRARRGYLAVEPAKLLKAVPIGTPPAGPGGA